MNFHSSEDDYYQEWVDEVEDGWIVALNFRNHVADEFAAARIDYYLALGGQFNTLEWRSFSPQKLFAHIESLVMKRLSI